MDMSEPELIPIKHKNRHTLGVMIPQQGWKRCLIFVTMERQFGSQKTKQNNNKKKTTHKKTHVVQPPPCSNMKTKVTRRYKVTQL